jgi:amidase
MTMTRVCLPVASRSISALCVLVFAALSACTPASKAPAESTSQSTQSVSYEATGLTAQSLEELSRALGAGEITSEAIVQAYLDRIAAVDRAGPRLQAVLAINPDALAQARGIDARRAAGETLGPLAGIPILIKDNIETSDPLPTTAGSLALRDNITGRDAPAIAGLREAGAIVIGKSNLSEWANFRDEDSVSGWSALGGQTRNPHMLDRSPCGSSSGSGAGVAAGLAAGAVGTETNGSIICPSHVNGIVGFKPTVGLLSQGGIVPISSSQDTAGPMTTTVMGTALMLSAMATRPDATDYTANLNPDALKGRVIGVLRFSVGTNPDIQATFERALADLQAAGATLVEIPTFTPGPEFGTLSRQVLDYEFKATINAYLSNAAPAVAVRSLDQLIAFNRENSAQELAVFGQSIFEKAAPLGDFTTPEYIAARDSVQRMAGPEGIDALLAQAGADVLVAPSGPLASRIDPINGDIWPAWAGAGYLAAIAGYPNLTVPMGEVHGIPLGISFIASAGEDANVLAYGYSYEQVSKRRVSPAYLPSAEARTELKTAMER